ncbi:HDIG domain-containing protein [Candidatus Berkelbacteria bacterium]|nr:HDIG domain-containing protein [Candidatus Berkelbacteria bacterium]
MRLGSKRYIITLVALLTLIIAGIALASVWLTERFNLNGVEAFGVLLSLSGIGAVFIAGLVTAGTPVLRDIFASYQNLFKLDSLSHPLLLRLQKTAPGTYHHSLNVANLSYMAAKKIGANATLARIGAYYHDIGKIKNPNFYTENQKDGQNPHQKLDPKDSAEIIIRHIIDGIKLCRRYKLPDEIIDFIPEHSGTTLVYYFYDQAKKQTNSEVYKRDYRYPGPKPMSKETAIVMLADSVEAATKSIKKLSPDKISDLVEKIIGQKQADRQLDLSGLSDTDLDKIKDVFTQLLGKINQRRISYPKQK